MSKKSKRTYSQSQALQDYFAESICGENKTYIEIGGHDPIKHSNTYMLEVHKGWTGFSVELNAGHQPRWESCKERNSKIYWADALTFDYINGINENNFSKHIGYLSCDIEPPINTFSALQRVINLGVKFDCITFEHDQYANKTGVDYNLLATEFLKTHGYKVAVYDVHPVSRPDWIFETWFVRNDIEFNTVDFSTWQNKLERK
jgi:hypothetical protein